ncbi:MAG: methylcobamide--CoM methyltransferase [Bacteroidetes bacterium]|jgi:uroporphyrinogen decarboxylase|nr:methylcobamide--CoM methyltransferase [Bacteroidota bacterium]
MKKISMKDWINKRLESEKREMMPVMTYPGLEFTGKKIIDLVTNGEEHFRCIEALAKYYPTIASVIVMDLSAEAEAFGSKISFRNDDVPTIAEKLLPQLTDVDTLNMPEVGAARTNEYLKAAALAANQISDRPTFAGMIGPYSLAGRLADITEMMTYIIMDPENSHKLLRKATDFLKEYAMKFKQTGADGIVVAEPAAGLLPAYMCDEFSSGYMKEIVDYVQDDNFLVILHNCGNTVELVESMVSTGAGSLHFGNAINMKDIMPQVPENIIAMGNIDPAGIIKSSTPEQVKNITVQLLKDMKPYPNFVLSTGCDVPPGSPKENIDAFFDALHVFNK